MLVDVAGDGDVPAGAVALDVKTVDGLATSGRCFCGSPDVQAVAAWADLDVVVSVCFEESCRYLVRLAVDEAVVEVDATDAFTEHEPESHACA